MPSEPCTLYAPARASTTEATRARAVLTSRAGGLVAKVKTLEERLWGAAVLKMSFRLRGAEDSPAFRGIYPGVLRDLDVEDEAVEAFITTNKERVEKAARGSAE